MGGGGGGGGVARPMGGGGGLTVANIGPAGTSIRRVHCPHLHRSNRRVLRNQQLCDRCQAARPAGCNTCSEAVSGIHAARAAKCFDSRTFSDSRVLPFGRDSDTSRHPLAISRTRDTLVVPWRGRRRQPLVGRPGGGPSVAPVGCQRRAGKQGQGRDA